MCTTLSFQLFPFVVSCNFLNYGPSGSLQQVTSLCVLYYNWLNTYTYVALWFVYLFFAALLSGHCLADLVHWFCCCFDSAHFERLVAEAENCHQFAVERVWSMTEPRRMHLYRIT